MWKRSVGILLCNLAIVLLPVCADAAIWGNPEHQELSDVFFRDLSMAIDLHGGIYGGRLANRLPGTVFDDEVVEMTGVLKTKLCPKLVCADVVVGVSALSLLEFQKKGLFYYGSFKHPDNLQFLKRKAIRTIAYDEFLSKAKPAVPYVVRDGDAMASLLSRYFIYDDANNNNKIDRSEIIRMRSDAFVEYCYAAGLAPIIKDDGVTLDITNTGDAEKLNSWHLGLLPVTPITQRASMTSATAQAPQMTVVDAKTQAQLLQGQILKGNEISVQVEDVESGPAYLEVRNGSYLADYNAETRPIPGPGVETGGASYTFQSESIGSLASGAVELRAYDYAGNYSDFSFGIPPLSAINLNSANALYNNFRGISAVSPSTLERSHSFEFSESVAGVSAVSIDGPQGNLWSQTFDPPVPSTYTAFSDLPIGDYVVKSFNAVGAETKTPFKIGELNIYISTGLSLQNYSYNDLLQPGKFNIRLHAVISSPAGVSKIQLISSTGTFLGEQILSNSQTEVDFDLPDIQLPNPLGICENGNQTCGPSALYWLRLFDVNGDNRDVSVPLTLAGGTINTSSDSTSGAYTQSGEYKSGVYDISNDFSLPILPGAATINYLSSGSTTPAVVMLNPVFTPNFAFVPDRACRTTNSDASLGTGELVVRTWSLPDKSDVSAGVLEDADLFAVYLTSAGVQTPADADCFSMGEHLPQYFICTRITSSQAKIFPLKRYVESSAIVNISPGFYISGGYHPDTGLCAASVPGFSSGIGVNFLGFALDVNAAPMRLLGNIAYGENISVPLNSNISVTFDNVLHQGNLGVSMVTGRPPSGYALVPKDTTFKIDSDEVLSFSDNVNLSFKYDASGLTLSQEQNLKLAKVVDPATGKYEILTATLDTGNKTISAKAASFSKFMVLVPEYSEPHSVQSPGNINGSPEMEFASGVAVSQSQYDLGATPGQPTLAALKSANKFPIGNVYSLTADTGTFEPSGAIKMRYSGGTVAGLGVDEDSLAIYGFTEGGDLYKLPYLTLDKDNKVLTARVTSAAYPLFAVLASSQQVENTPPSVYPDGISPETTLNFSGIALPVSDGTYISSATTIEFSASDPQVQSVVTSGVNLTNYILSPGSATVEISTYTAPFILPEGAHPVYYMSVDNAGNYEFPRATTIYMDATPPETQLSVSGMTLAPDTSFYATVSGTITLNAVDPYVRGAQSGVFNTFYLMEKNFSECLNLAQFLSSPSGQLPTFNGRPGTCENPLYTAPFTLSPGTHTVQSLSLDNVRNMESPKTFHLEVASEDTVLPEVFLSIDGSTIAAGGSVEIMPETQIMLSAVDPEVNGTASGVKAVYYLVDITTASCQAVPDMTGPAGTCRNPLYAGPFILVVGTHTVYYTAEDNAGNPSEVKSAFFTVLTAQTVLPISPSSGPIGVPFTIEGSGFGAYSAGTTVVLIGGTTAPLTLWTDTKIQGTVPGTLAGGQQPISVRRGSTVLAEVSSFTVTQPALYTLTPSSGAIGIPFIITGESFGNYVANYTRVLLGGATMPLTLWTDTRIQGTIPGTLSVGDYELVVERALNGGVVRTSTTAFSLRNMEAYWLAPSSGPIGMPFTITGVGFGNYSSVYTHVLIGDTTAPLTLWTDTKIQGTVPGSLASGQYPVLVERKTSDGGLMQTSPMTFEVVNVDVASMTPVAGPIGLPFTIYGNNFGNYVANYTRVLIGGTTAPLTLWTSDKIQGSIPGALGPGEYPVIVERELNGGIVQSPALAFVVSTPTVYNMSPSSGPIGMPFTITGENFGNYAAGYTKVLIGGATAPLTLWADTQIKGTIPGTLAAGVYELYVERALNGGVVRTSTFSFTVGTPYLDTLSPSTASVIAPFTITGYNFGNYVANYTKVLINGTTTALTLWTDSTIQGKLPFLPAGQYPVQVQRYLNGGLAESATAWINIEEPVISSMTPTSGAAGTVFNLYGTGFGPYDAAIARVTIGGAACSLSLWTDTRITGTVPSALSYGTHTVVASRGQTLSNALEFYIPGGYSPSMMRPGLSPSALEFKLGEVYVYPDPAKGGKVPTFHIEVGTADNVKIRIYTVSGQLAHERTLTGSPQATGQGYAYEYAWTGRIASGVYYYTIEAERSGKKLKTKGRFSVVR